MRSFRNAASPALLDPRLRGPHRTRLGTLQAVLMLRTVTWPELKLLLEGAVATFSASTQPCSFPPCGRSVGVAIGFNPKLARFIQPLAQIRLPPSHGILPHPANGLVKIAAASALDRSPSCCSARSGTSVQRDRRRQRPLRPARVFSLSLSRAGNAGPGSFFPHLSLPHYWHGDGMGAPGTRQSLRVLPNARQLCKPLPRRADRCRD